MLYSVDISTNIKQFLDPDLSFPSGVWIPNEWMLIPLGLNRYVTNNTKIMHINDFRRQLGQSGVLMCAQRIHGITVFCN